MNDMAGNSVQRWRWMMTMPSWVPSWLLRLTPLPPCGWGCYRPLSLWLCRPPLGGYLGRTVKLRPLSSSVSWGSVRGVDGRLNTHLDLWLSGGLFVVMVLKIVLDAVVMGLSLLLLVDVVCMLLSFDVVYMRWMTIDTVWMANKRIIHVSIKSAKIVNHVIPVSFW